MKKISLIVVARNSALLVIYILSIPPEWVSDSPLLWTISLTVEYRRQLERSETLVQIQPCPLHFSLIALISFPFQSCVQYDAALLDMREYKVDELGLKNDYFFGEFSLNYHL